MNSLPNHPPGSNVHPNGDKEKLEDIANGFWEELVVSPLLDLRKKLLLKIHPMLVMAFQLCIGLNSTSDLANSGKLKEYNFSYNTGTTAFGSARVE